MVVVYDAKFRVHAGCDAMVAFVWFIEYEILIQ